MGLWDTIKSIGKGIGGGVKDMFEGDDNQRVMPIDPSWWQYGGDQATGNLLRQLMWNEAGRYDTAYDPYANAAISTGQQTNTAAQSLADLNSAAGYDAAAVLDNFGRNALDVGYKTYDPTGTTTRLNDLSVMSQNATANPAVGQAVESLLNLGTNGYNPTLGNAPDQIRAAGAVGVGPMTTSGIAGLNQFALGPQGPSAAQAQLQAGLNANNAAATSIAASARGRGASGAAMQQAVSQQAANNQVATNQAAVLRAQEAQAARAQNLSALTAGAQIGATAETNAAGLNLQGQVSAGQLQMELEKARQQGDTQRVAALTVALQGGLGQGELALAGLGQAADITGNAGAFGLNAYGANQANMFQGLNTALGANQQGFNSQVTGNQAALDAYLGGAGAQQTGIMTGLTAQQQAEADRQAWLNQYGDTWEAEADRRTQLGATQMGVDAALKRSNSEMDARADEKYWNFFGDLIKAAGAGV